MRVTRATKALSENGNPTLDEVNKVLHAVCLLPANRITVDKR